jgi:hypothetical protein
MSWTPKEKEIQVVPGLPGPKRYEYFVKHTADENQIWSLWQGGWALARDSQGRELVPVWPHQIYAEACATKEWEGYAPQAISMDAWLERWIPGMIEDKRFAAVFPTPEDKGIVVEPRRLEADLRAELEHYE